MNRSAPISMHSPMSMVEIQRLPLQNVEYVTENFKGVENHYKDLAIQFVTDVPKRMECMFLCISNEQLDEASRVAHSIVGVSKLLGLERVGEMFRHAELTLKTPHASTVSSSQLQDAFDSTLQMLGEKYDIQVAQETFPGA